MDRSTTGILAGLAAASIWGGMYVVSKIVLDIIPPFTLVTLRLLLGTLVLWLIIVRHGGLNFTRRQILQAIAVGWVGYGISLGFQFVGTHLSTASNSALVTSATPAFVLLFAFWILGEQITLRKLAALLIATFGVVAVIDPRAAQFNSSMFLGNLSLIAAALTWALYSVLVRKVTFDLDVLPATMVFFWGGLCVSIPASIWELQIVPLGQITWGVILGILYLGVISTALAMYLWNKAFATLEAGIASLTFFAQPVVGASLGVLFLDEQITLLFIIGGLLISLGLWLASQPG